MADMMQIMYGTRKRSLLRYNKKTGDGVTAVDIVKAKKYKLITSQQSSFQGHKEKITKKTVCC